MLQNSDDEAELLDVLVNTGFRRSVTRRSRLAQIMTAPAYNQMGLGADQDGDDMRPYASGRLKLGTGAATSPDAYGRMSGNSQETDGSNSEKALRALNSSKKEDKQVYARTQVISAFLTPLFMTPRVSFEHQKQDPQL